MRPKKHDNVEEQLHTDFTILKPTNG